MTVKETSWILSLLHEYYCNMEPSTDATAKAWHHVLCEYSYDAVKYAVVAFVKSDIKGFPPKPGQLIAQLTRNGAKDAEAEAQEAWVLIRKAISNAGTSRDWLGDHLDPKTHAEHRFDELPPMVQRIVGNPQQLTRWGEMDTGQLDTVVQSNFLRAYKARADNAYNALLGVGHAALPMAQGVVKQLGEGNDE